MGEDDLVGDCCVELSRLLKPGQNDFPVKYNKKLAGKLEWTTQPLESVPMHQIAKEWDAAAFK